MSGKHVMIQPHKHAMTRLCNHVMTWPLKHVMTQSYKHVMIWPFEYVMTRLDRVIAITLALMPMAR